MQSYLSKTKTPPRLLNLLFLRPQYSSFLEKPVVQHLNHIIDHVPGNAHIIPHSHNSNPHWLYTSYFNPSLKSREFLCHYLHIIYISLDTEINFLEIFYLEFPNSKSETHTSSGRSNKTNMELPPSPH